MDKNEKVENNEIQVKKQKPGLGAIRPSDYTENLFKKMANEEGSQTALFEKIFWYYINDRREEERQKALNLESEISLISNDLNDIFKQFKIISDKAQNTILSTTTNAEQTEKNLHIEIDTLKKSNEEIQKRNTELEQANSAFNEIKTGLETRITDLKKEIENKENEIKALNAAALENDKQNKELVRQLKDYEKNNIKLQNENDKLTDENSLFNAKIRNLENSNINLTNTLNTIDSLKKAEISSIEAKYQAIISELESKIKTFEDNKQKEIENLEKSILLEMETDKKMAVAELKVELSEVKSKYAEQMLAASETNIKYEELRKTFEELKAGKIKK